MKTWRERIAEARENGKFTQEDQKAWLVLETCPAGELVDRFGLRHDPAKIHHKELHAMGTAIGHHLYTPCDIDAFEDAFDNMEDRAIQLKRERV